MGNLLTILIVIAAGFWLYSKFAASTRKVERAVNRVAKIAAPPSPPAKRPPRKRKSPAAGPSIKPLLTFKADVDLTCGHPAQVSPFGLDEETEVTCEACGASGPIGEDAFDEASMQFNDAVCDLWDDRELDPPSDEVIEFMRINRRKPTGLHHQADPAQLGVRPPSAGNRAHHAFSASGGAPAASDGSAATTALVVPDAGRSLA